MRNRNTLCHRPVWNSLRNLAQSHAGSNAGHPLLCVRLTQRNARRLRIGSTHALGTGTRAATHEGAHKQHWCDCFHGSNSPTLPRRHAGPSGKDFIHRGRPALPCSGHVGLILPFRAETAAPCSCQSLESCLATVSSLCRTKKLTEAGSRWYPDRRAWSCTGARRGDVAGPCPHDEWD